MIVQMFTANECRAKALAATSFANQAPDIASRTAWLGVCEEWRALAVMAQAQEAWAVEPFGLDAA